MPLVCRRGACAGIKAILSIKVSIENNMDLVSLFLQMRAMGRSKETADGWRSLW
jgi:hypothetical protein